VIDNVDYRKNGKPKGNLNGIENQYKKSDDDGLVVRLV